MMISVVPAQAPAKRFQCSGSGFGGFLTAGAGAAVTAAIVIMILERRQRFLNS